jgi:hypothetical protein
MPLNRDLQAKIQTANEHYEALHRGEHDRETFRLAVVSGGKFVSKLTANVANSRNGLKLMDYKKFGESVRAGEAELEALRQTILKMRAEGQGMGAIQDKFRGTALDGLDEAALDKFCAADTLEKKVAWAVATF